MGEREGLFVLWESYPKQKGMERDSPVFVRNKIFIRVCLVAYFQEH